MPSLWISVKSALPFFKNRQKTIVLCTAKIVSPNWQDDRYYVTKAWYCTMSQRWMNHDCTQPIHSDVEITYWQPLPKLPEPCRD